MSVTSVNLVSASSSHNIKNERTYTRTYIVEHADTDDEVDIENGFCSITGFLAGVTHPSDGGAVCKELTTSLDSEDGKSSTVTINFGPWDEEEKNPLLQPPDIQYSISAQHEKIIDKDQQGQPVVNSAGDPFDDPTTIDESRLTLSVSQNNATFPAAMALAYVGAVNSDSWNSGSPRQWKCVSISGRKMYDAEYGVYYAVSTAAQFKPDKWDIEILDQGTRNIDKEKFNVDGKAELLDGQGEKLAQGASEEWLPFRIYNELPFTGVFTY